ncbi:MAG: T9SS type A sorting domain-containing protein [Flavobacteriales bacterium]|nr:T9SS type A sorting domain-containing protein [Flavobacteriales bacterium]MCB9185803.1 T9SS type A sorting domain-containing protein [Flavobacteriales bacterium]MCB9187506.1 T9SS type A sorting domain-containing protein [Flavobacteriales bacterium]MCB9190669.1 T9SS type A sorting domain-containing protein [Flavobacteriales bacterium]
MKKLTSIIALVGASVGLHAQSITPDVVASAGTHFSNGTTQLSWTIGEPVIATHDNGTNILTQGFHQTLLTVTGIRETEAVLEGVSVYPNPVDYLLNIKFDAKSDDVSAILFDAAGRMVSSEQINSGTSQHQLDLGGFANGTYLLRLMTEEGLQASFNIQKVQQ